MRYRVKQPPPAMGAVLPRVLSRKEIEEGIIIQILFSICVKVSNIHHFAEKNVVHLYVYDEEAAEEETMSSSNDVYAHIRYLFIFLRLILFAARVRVESFYEGLFGEGELVPDREYDSSGSEFSDDSQNACDFIHI